MKVAGMFSKAQKGLAALLAVGLLAAGVAIAEGGGSRPDRSASFEPFQQHQVAGPSQAVGGTASKARRPFSKVRYVESEVTTVVRGAELSGSLKCPRRSTAIGGYFGDNKPGVVLDYSAVGAGSTRRWDFGIILLSDFDPQAKVFVGVVCIK
jgi:hypothetical protein